MNIGVILSGLAPVFLITALGYVLKATLLKEELQWQAMEKISYWILIPCLIARTLMSADLGSVPLGRLALTLLLSLTLVVLLVLLLLPWFRRRNQGSLAEFSSVFQVSSRWNAFIAIAIVLELYGQRGVALTAVAMVILIPIINVGNIIMLTLCLSRSRLSPLSVTRRILSNPVIVGCAAGLGLAMFEAQPWTWILSVLDVLSEATLGVILLCVGAGLDFSRMHKPDSEAAIGVMLKLVLMPALAIVIGLLLGLSGELLYIAVIAAAVPSAVNGYVLAKEMGGDAPLYANAVTLQMLFSVVTIPFWLYLVYQLDSLS